MFWTTIAEIFLDIKLDIIFLLYKNILYFQSIALYFESHPLPLCNTNGIRHEHIRYRYDAFRNVGVEEDAFSNNAQRLWRCS